MLVITKGYKICNAFSRCLSLIKYVGVQTLLPISSLVCLLVFIVCWSPPPRLGQELPEAVTVQVGHGETLLPLLSLLGLYKDPAPPTADNYSQQHGTLCVCVCVCGEGVVVVGV